MLLLINFENLLLRNFFNKPATRRAASSGSWVNKTVNSKLLLSGKITEFLPILLTESSRNHIAWKWCDRPLSDTNSCPGPNEPMPGACIQASLSSLPSLSTFSWCSVLLEWPQTQAAYLPPACSLAWLMKTTPVSGFSVSSLSLPHVQYEGEKKKKSDQPSLFWKKPMLPLVLTPTSSQWGSKAASPRTGPFPAACFVWKLPFCLLRFKNIKD